MVNENNNMKRIDQDFSETLIYLSNLFGKKNMRAFDFNGFPIEFIDKEVITGNSRTVSSDLPLAGEDVVAIKLRVLGLNGREWEEVKIQNDAVISRGSVNAELLNDFIDVLERSTFRYF